MRWQNQSHEEARKTSGTSVTVKPHMSAPRTYFFMGLIRDWQVCKPGAFAPDIMALAPVLMKKKRNKVWTENTEGSTRYNGIRPEYYGISTEYNGMKTAPHLPRSQTSLSLRKWWAHKGGREGERMRDSGESAVFTEVWRRSRVKFRQRSRLFKCNREDTGIAGRGCVYTKVTKVVWKV